MERIEAQAPLLRQSLLAWWEIHGRHDLPWKQAPGGVPAADGEPLDAYGIWVAEVMLQQTRLPVALPYWRQWMTALPSVLTLAAAAEGEVLLLWQGLGYYARARRLQQGARQLFAVTAEAGTFMSAATGTTTSSTGDHWPRSLEGWLALPGIGRSTAGSILSAAFDRPAAILDGNAARVLARLIAHPGPPKRQQALFWRLSETLLDPARPRAFNQALMDLGATLCTPRNPGCDHCPWSRTCAAYAAGDPGRYPVKEAPRSLPFQVIGVGVVLDSVGRVLIDQRLEEGLLGGLWEFPGGKQEPGESIEATIRRELREELAIEAEVGEELITLEHAYSHKRLRFVVHLCRWQAGEPAPLASQQVRWVDPTELDAYPFPAANARIIAALRAWLGLAGAGRADQPGVSRPAA